MKRLPIGVQSFRVMIEEDYLYVDKTRALHRLLTTGGQYYFLSRPRRFGKSLLVSTLKEIFSGNKELFKNLWIYDKIDWESYPIIHIDFTAMDYATPDLLKQSIDETLQKTGAAYGIELTSLSFKTRFGELIQRMAADGKVVILVDEYDKPIIDKIDDLETAKANREILKEFYSILKAADNDIKFTLLTGVSRFSRVSVFSGLNNLDDITIDDSYSTMLGYTEEELFSYFKDRLETLKTERSDGDTLTDNIRSWYNGYSWDGENFVYNPFSVLNFFKKKQFGNYWFATGTPTFLVKLLLEKGKDIREYEAVTAGDYVFESYDIENLETISLLFQTGYLTIKSRRMVKAVDGDEMEYILSYPNKEVRDSFIRHLFRAFTGKDMTDGENILRRLTAALKNSEYEQFFQIIRSLFASIPYNIVIKEKEAYYHSIMYMIFRLMGTPVLTEVQTATGRIDAVIETEDQLLVVEFKMGTADEALEQIKKKQYHLGYLTSSKPLKLLGIGFDMEQRNLRDYRIESV